MIMLRLIVAATFTTGITLVAPTISSAQAAPMTTYKVCSDSRTGNNIAYVNDLGRQEVKDPPMTSEDGLFCTTYEFYPDEYQFEAVSVSGNGSLGYASCSIRHGTTVVASSRDYDEYGYANASCTA
ncbi:hypothetical protein ACTD5D_21295 [Nocardia takedensis]|uniref:hypothetical protein n=1 Tax=Nocardia takedensis TaxID=259390 RepID=UPI003F772D77